MEKYLVIESYNKILQVAYFLYTIWTSVNYQQYIFEWKIKLLQHLEFMLKILHWLENSARNVQNIIRYL